MVLQGESHRKKMAASFHQRVVVGEEMVPGGKNYHSRDLPASVTLNGQHSLVYQGRSRDVSFCFKLIQRKPVDKLNLLTHRL